MRGVALALGLGAAAGLWQPAVDRPAVVVVVDATAETTDAAASARLRQQALERLELGAHPVYVELTRAAARRVPESERDAFRRTTFAVEEPTYNGIHMTVGDAAEILRGNEPLRDEFAARECGDRSGCRSTVIAAARLRATDGGDDTTRDKVARLVGVARAAPGATLVLVTAGWPYRDAGRAGIDAAVRDLHALGTPLVVLRQPGREAYGGLVKDAAETIASRLKGEFVVLSSEAEAARVDARFASRFPIPADTAGAAPPNPAATAGPAPAPPSDASSALPFPAPTDIDVPAAEGIGATAGGSKLPADLVRAASYVERFERTFSSVVWREHSTQEVRVERKFGISGATFSALAARRRLDSEFFFLWLPADASWIAVRDVIAIDGTPRPAGERRLQALLRDRAASTAALRTLATENGRFDIGTITRTFTEPTLVLLFLDPHYRHRFTFDKVRDGRAAGRATATYRFVERGLPTVIRNRDLDAPATGTLTIDPETGAVLATSLELRVPAEKLYGRVAVRFGAHPRFDVLVPVASQEMYAAPKEQVTTTATYSDFRRFETAARLVP